MTRQDIQRVIEKVPGLNEFGVGLYAWGRPQEDRGAIFRADTEALLASEEACTKVCDWLGAMEKTKTINTRDTSYGLKHLAAHEIGYVTNGVFIAAAVHCGFPYRLTPGRPNVEFGISEKSLKERGAK